MDGKEAERIYRESRGLIEKQEQGMESCIVDNHVIVIDVGVYQWRKEKGGKMNAFDFEDCSIFDYILKVL